MVNNNDVLYDVLNLCRTYNTLDGERRQIAIEYIFMGLKTLRRQKLFFVLFYKNCNIDYLQQVDNYNRPIGKKFFV